MAPVTPERPAWPPAGDADGAFELALFPLRTVLFPGGLLPLKIFEPRYLDLMARCLREGSGFGVVALREGGEVAGSTHPVLLERTGVLAELDAVDSTQPGILMVRSRGTRRFRLRSPRRQADGLWLADAVLLPDEPAVPLPEARQGVAEALQQAIEALAAQEIEPFLRPHRLDDAGWVANRWAEVLPLPLAAKQRLMEEPDALRRLDVVEEYLRGERPVA
jgi:Lon protease-like protein